MKKYAKPLAVEHANFADILQYQAKTQANEIAYIFLVNGEDEEIRLTYSELDIRAKSIAMELTKVCSVGDRALLMFPSCLDFITAFFGCLYAGVIAVPAYPPKKNRKMDRLQHIIDDCDAKTVLSVGKMFDNAYTVFKKNNALQDIIWIKVDDIEDTSSATYENIKIDPNQLAFIQYTSGSTGQPKGVMVSHKNLIENSRMIYKSMGHSSKSIVVSWLPLFHDMGLIGGVLQSLFGGFHSVLMAPESFLLKPVRWLKAISKYRATSSGAPNFAYELCCNIQEEQLSDIDLSSWKIAFCGAEPIQAETVIAFFNKMKTIGYSESTFYPCYGMAESTLFITGIDPFNKPAIIEIDKEKIQDNKFKLVTDKSIHGKQIVGCGRTDDDHKVIIVDPNTKAVCKDTKVGEIWFSGESVARGYWGKEELNEEIFNAYTSDTNSGPFLRTGDLGVIYVKELYVTGRFKDIIIIRGKNHYPQDIELSVSESHESLITGSTAAFSIEMEGEEKLVIVQEVKRTHIRSIIGEEVVNAIKQNIFDNHDLQLYAVVLINPYSISKTSSGKIQRRLCKENYKKNKLSPIYTWTQEDVIGLDEKKEISKTDTKIISKKSIEDLLIEKLSRFAKIPEENIDKKASFSNYNIDSLNAVRLAGELEEEFTKSFPVSLAYDYPTINKLSSFLWKEINNIKGIESDENNINDKKSEKEAIAIIGMECNFPGAQNTEEFWNLLSKGEDAVKEVPIDRWNWKDYYSPEIAKGKMNTKWGGFIQDVDMFDTSFFQITPIEAKSMDPQQRLLLEQTYKAIEKSGYVSDDLSGSKTGVFVGIGNNDYGTLLNEKKDNHSAYLGTGNSFSIAANRISYYFNFQGPSYSVDTACSSSLTSVHLACQSLNNSECNLAIAGGVNLILTPDLTVALSQANMMSKDGKCKTFDDDSNGYVRGEGCGVLVLKRLSEAKSDGDNILAVIQGSAIGQDGKSNSITAPNGIAQQHVIKQALSDADTNRNDIQFIETHGSATELGDPIEIQALNEVYGSDRSIDKPIILGAVKANIGHLEACAGMAGLIKTVLCLKHKKIPPQLHVTTLNKHLKWETLPFKIPFKLTDWKSGDNGLRKAGVSGFGFGGSNAHIILSEAEDANTKEIKNKPELSILPLSAKNYESLLDNLTSYIAYLKKSDTCIHSICNTAAKNRNHFELRKAFTGKSKVELVKKMESVLGDLRRNKTIESFKSGKTSFMFSGQGSQYAGMGKELYGLNPVFTSTINECEELLKKEINISLKELLWGDSSDLLARTEYTQAVLFAFEVSLAKMWISYGIKPDILIGHSIGEFAAACIANVFSIEDGIKLVSARGRLMRELTQEGSMLAVLTSYEKIMPFIKKYENKVSIAVINSQGNCVVSGETTSIKEIKKILEDENITAVDLKVSHAFHSPMMTPMLSEFRKIAKQINYNPPSVPMVSNVNGEIFTDNECNAGYWVKHVEATVLFGDGIKCIDKFGVNTLIEIGPSSTLLGIAANSQNANTRIFLPTLKKKQPAYNSFLNSILKLYESGVDIKWTDLMSEDNYPIADLPAYSFNKKSYWVERVNYGTKEKIITNEHKPESSLNIKDLKSEIKEIINNITGISGHEIKDDTNLMSMGFDSLMLVHFQKELNKKFNVEIKLEKLFADLNDINKISDFIGQQEKSYLNIQPEINTSNKIPSVFHNDLDEYIKHIQSLNENLISNLRNISNMGDFVSKTDDPDSLIAKQKIAPKYKKGKSLPDLNFRTYKFELDRTSLEQILFVRSLIKRYNDKTINSKSENIEIRKNCSHWLSSLNYRQSLKEMLYPLIAKKASGAYFWDIDGNEYIDIAMGYGVHFFGHKPDFIKNEIIKQLDKGYCLTPHSDNLLEVSKLFKKITNVDKLTYCNTGSEAVIFAIRIARTVTKRNKVVKFAGSYHGVYDGILAESVDDEIVPMCPGITEGSVDETEVLLFGIQESLERIKELKNEIAAVIVEPVQSRHPGVHLREYLQKLRNLTEEIGAALIFDEMITGFRIHPRGAQSYFNIDADIITYGKIVGGGLPVGIVAGKSKYMDAVDDGNWNYGDASTPLKSATFIAGTFANHPLLLASMKAVLEHIDEHGIEIYDKINYLTANFADGLNKFFIEENVPIVIKNFGSVFRFESIGAYSLALNPLEMDLFFYLLKLNGVYTWERRICFFSTAHTDSDIEKIKNAVQKSIKELRAGGFTFSTIENPINSEKVLKMSSVQKRIYSLCQFEGGDLPYHITNAMIIKGSLNVEKLKSAIKSLILRHESLRTSFFVDGDDFYQKIENTVTADITEKQILKENIDIEIKEFIKPFDLSKAPLIRILIGKISDFEYLFLIDIHHIVADGYSANILSQELMAYYMGNDLGIPTKQYIDYVEWEQKYFLSDRYKSQQNYWKSQFSEIHEPLELPYDFQRPAEKKHTGFTLNSEITSTQTLKIKDYCKSNGVTRYNFLFSAFNILLHKLSGQEDISVGSPVAVRDHGDFENAIGMFTNTLVLRNQVSGTKIFKDFLDEIKDNFVQNYVNKEFPYELLVKDIKADKEKNRNPLFDIVFIYENGNDRIFIIDDIEFETYDYDSNSSMFDLSFEIIEEKDSLNFNINFDSHLFEIETIKRWKNYFEKIIDEVISNPGILLKDIDILTEQEKHQLLVEFNDTKTEYPKEKTIVKLIEEQVARTPKNIAVVFEDIELNYKELNEKANIVAHYLRNKYDIKPDDLAGILLERSEKMIVAILGILKAGGAYVPIDPEYPRDRINYMLEDSNPKVVIGDNNEVLKPGTELIAINDMLESGMSKDNPITNTKPDNLAYAIYTSGSTGKPKGTLIEHFSVVNLLYSLQNKYRFTPSDVYLLKTNYTFDVSISEIFCWIFEGGKIAILSPKKEKDSYAIIDSIFQHKVTHVNFVPSMFSAFSETLLLQYSKAVSLKYIFLAGEALNVVNINKVEKLLTKTLFANLYGPTEATVYATWYSVNKAVLKSNIPIGTPLRNTTIYILDKEQKLVPMSVPGELCISGDGIARGYLKRPELTAEKFVDNPFISGERMYKTGDLARWLPDGNIEFLGRIDDQVKIRGFRIELGEIETNLIKHKEVKDAVVTAQTDENNNKYLCAYYTSEEEIIPSEFRSFLGKEFPDYMIPGFFVHLPEIPLTANGKVNKKALPKHDGTINTGVEYVAPTNETEEKLVEIWQKVLGIEQVGILDNFFELGGDSIKAIQIIARLNKYKLKATVSDLFKNTQIKDFSPLVTKQEREISQEVVIGKVPLTPIQQWFFKQNYTQKNHFNQAVMLFSKEDFNERILKKTFEEIINHHDSLRMTYEVKEDAIQQLNRDINIRNDYFEVIDLREENDYKQVIEKKAELYQAGFNIEEGRLIKICLFKTITGSHLLIAFHHLIIDGISWRILLEDLKNTYQQKLKNKPVTLPLKTDSYKYWAEQLIEYSKSKKLKREVIYWSDLENIQADLLPKDFKTDEKSADLNKKVNIELDKETTQTLLESVNSAYNTNINDILLTSLGMSLRQWCGMEKVFVNLEGHGREEIADNIDVSRTIGWFTSMYPVLLDMSNSSELSYQIRSVKESLRKIPNKGIGYGILKYLSEKDVQGDLKFSIKPEIIFNYLGQFDNDITNEIFGLSKLDAGNDSSMFNKKEHALDINGMVVGGELKLLVSYNSREFKEENITLFTAIFKNKLEEIIHHCTEQKRTVLSPSDYNCAELTIDEFDNIKTHTQQILPSAVLKEIYPLTPMQNGMVFHNIMDQSSLAYFTQTSYKLKGELKLELIEKAFNQLIERHDILRTNFIISPNKTHQIVLDKRYAKVNFEDISELDEVEKEKYEQEYKEKDISRGFDLEKDLLIRLAVLKLNSDQYTFIWSFHHILMDGWCLGILAKEFTRLYDSINRNTKPELLPVNQYGSYLQWISNRDGDDDLIYWENYLSAYDGQTGFPKLDNKQAVDYNLEIEDLTLDKETSEHLDILARKNMIPLNILIQAVWGLLLAKYNNTDDVLFGSVVSGRPATIDGIESMVGLFINTLPVRIRIDESKSFFELVKDVYDSSIESKDYEYCSLADIQGLTEQKGALIQSLYVFENYPLDEELSSAFGNQSIDIEITDVKAFEQTNYDLNIIVLPGKKLTLSVSYNRNVYDNLVIKNALSHISTIIDSVLNTPEIKIRDIDILTEQEKHQLMVEFNDTKTDFAKDKAIHELFEEQAKRTPNAYALVRGSNKLTYKEFNLEVDKLFNILINKGIKCNNFVAIFADQSIEFLISIFAVLKAGGAYVPIDDNYPATRKNYIIQDCEAKIILSTKSVRNNNKETLKDIGDDQIINVDELDNYEIPVQHDPIKLKPDNLIYLIYTSGSTGNPKGAAVYHKSFANLVHWFISEYTITDIDRVLLMSSTSFDLTQKNLFASLLKGGSLHLLPSAHYDPYIISDIISKEKITWVNCTPSAFYPIVEAKEESLLEKLNSLRFVFLGGEPISMNKLSYWLSLESNKTKLVNTYGPTEATDICASFIIEEPTDYLDKIIPIGKPIYNVHIFILDKNHRIVPIGILGELCISGAGLALGYLNNTALSSEKFIEHPYKPDERLYKTGDLVRWLPDGNIEFLGRIDHQVKIRGFRIELGEIESLLQKHDQIKDCVVIDIEENGDKYLCAYLVTGEEINKEEIRSYLLASLPDYMIPGFFVHLSEIPLTANGKVNRKALPKPEGSISTGVEYVAPTNEIEEKLVEIWQQVLGVKQVGILDNFFDLGGHSLKAVTILSNIQKNWDITISMNEIFSDPTISNLANKIEIISLMSKQETTSDGKNNKKIII